MSQQKLHFVLSLVYERFFIAYPGKIPDEMEAWINGWSKELTGLDARLIDMASKVYLGTNKEINPPTPMAFKDFCNTLKKSKDITPSDLTIIEEMSQGITQGLDSTLDGGMINIYEMVDVFLLSASVTHNKAMLSAGLQLTEKNISEVLIPRLYKIAKLTQKWIDEDPKKNENNQ